MPLPGHFSVEIYTLWAVIPTAAIFLVVDIGFFTANLAKIAQGGWIPLTLGFIIYGIMVSWRTGVTVLRARLSSLSMPAAEFFAQLAKQGTPRVPGTAVFLTRTNDQIPAAIVEYVRSMGSLYENVIALRINFEEMPRIEPGQRHEVEQLAPGFWKATVRYGFMEKPDLTRAVAALPGLPRTIDFEHAVFFGTRDTVVAAKHSALTGLRLTLFSFLFRNAVRASDRFNLPAGRTMEVARQVVV